MSDNEDFDWSVVDFDDRYMVFLESMAKDIKKFFNLEFTDHALVRLCRDLENELLQGENKYE